VKPEIIFQYSPWYIILCIGLGIAYAFLFYRKSIFTKNINRILAISRAILVSLLALLLLNPLFKYINSVISKPKVVMMVDNSQSMKMGGENLLKNLGTSLFELKNELNAKDFETTVQSFTSDQIIENASELKFDAKKSNLASPLQNLKSNFDGQNLSDVILVSDGIINDGVAPTYTKFGFNVHTIGFGDTTAKKDIKISGITANKIAYLGSKFTVNVDIEASFFQNQVDFVQIKNSQGKILERKNFTISKADYFSSQTFEVSAEKAGKVRYIVEVGLKSGEFSSVNNQKEVIVEIVDGKENILIVAPFPHPDIKALKSILDKNDLFNTEIQIQPSSVSTNPFDILILYQFPHYSGLYQDIVAKYQGLKKPTFYFTGSQTNLSTFNAQQEVLSITAGINKTDKVLGESNNLFQKYQIDALTDDILSKVPPLTVPFGDYKLKTGSENILTQKIGNIKTDKSILSLNLNAAQKTAVFVGEGLWLWRLEEYALSERNNLVDDLILKTLQLISLKEDKSKLRIYPTSDVFSSDDKINIVAETYNNLYEKIYNQNIKLKISGDKGFSKTFDFVNTKDQNSFVLSSFPPGVYDYEASASILNKKEISKGQIVVSAIDLERSNATADFNILKTIAAEQNGKFVVAANMNQLLDIITSNKSKSVVSTAEELKDVINIKVLLVLLLVLATLEWFLRKYFGQY
jgi:hypothetical protein